ncbi:MAG: carbonic anhydrase [Bacteroidota bacterium]|nr:carbonic anhydrase [Bacteroidota bacterium]
MKPSKVIELIRKGNESFVEQHEEGFFTSHTEKQNPLITLLTCSDSRVQTSAILPDPINKIFTIENIGNQISNSEGSVDYGILHLKTPVLLILGHADCGAIKAYSAGYEHEPASIQRELNNLQPAFINADEDEDIISRIRRNINYQINVALAKYSELVDKGELVIVGAYYDFANDLGKGRGRLHILNLNGKYVQ